MRRRPDGAPDVEVREGSRQGQDHRRLTRPPVRRSFRFIHIELCPRAAREPAIGLWKGAGRGTRERSVPQTIRSTRTESVPWNSSPLDLREQLLANGRNPDSDIGFRFAKWFNPGRRGHLADRPMPIPKIPTDVHFGLMDLGFGTPELGTVRLSELEAFQGPFGLGIERDLWFQPAHTIGVYAEAARNAGRIVEFGPELDEAARSRTGPVED